LRARGKALAIAGSVRRAPFSCQDLVIALVLFNCIVCFAAHPIKSHTNTCKQLFLCSSLVAQKLWDDDSVETTDIPLVRTFATQTKNPTPDSVCFGDMESILLSLLKFNVDVGPTLYAEYYFRAAVYLREELCAHVSCGPFKPSTGVATSNHDGRVAERVANQGGLTGQQGGLKAKGRAVRIRLRSLSSLQALDVEKEITGCPSTPAPPTPIHCLPPVAAKMYSWTTPYAPPKNKAVRNEAACGVLPSMYTMLYANRTLRKVVTHGAMLASDTPFILHRAMAGP
jgi:hypothetical protein